MTVLLTGGTGKTATPLANLLLKANIPFLVANRSGNVPPPYKGVHFDWLDASTYQLPFDADKSIDRIYLVAPPVHDCFTPMKAFIDFAVDQGVKRFVLLSGASLPKGGPLMGKVHEYLASIDVEYCVLRPSWFFDNFRLQLAPIIRERSEIANAAQAGLIGWISTEDIADVAFEALTAATIEHTNPVMVGPELLSYAQITQMLSDATGRKIVHKNLTPDQYKQLLLNMGMPEEHAGFLAVADQKVSEGVDEKHYKEADFVGKRRMKDFIAENKHVWRTA
ncbi:NAD(P)-binding protein [Favolaschia claudopus]|uniref:NAD(P)-binding protein n=1 Tax=Favolaschia claudopus TaxID=2862362 RepID=A0AAW0E1G8_9AGAR